MYQKEEYQMLWSFWKKGEIKMKKSLKNILICLSIIYFIISLCYSMYLKGAYTEQVNAIMENNSSMVLIGDIGLDKFDGIREYRAKIEIIDINLISMAIALIIGGIIGFIMSVKENSKVKYILYFIIGNIIFNITWTFMQIIIHNSVNTIYSLNFIRTYINTTLKTIIPYMIVYILILYANISNNKQRVNNLNASLNNEKVKKEFKINKKAIIIIITILVIIIATLIGSVGRRTIVLIKYSKVINELVNTENYYVKTVNKIERNEDEEIVNSDEYISDYYYKNGMTLEKNYKNGELNSTTYMDEKDMLIITEEFTILQERDKYDFERKGIYNYYYGDTYPRIWQNIALAFNVNIDKVEYNGISCYKIKRKNNDIVYVNSKTYEPVGVTNITTYNRYGDNVIEAKTISEKTYTITKDIVKDEDIARPNLGGAKTYTFEELNQRNNKTSNE